MARSISVGTKNRIQEAVKKLGYCPNLHASSLRSKRSYTVGVMVLDMTTAYCIPILKGIEQVLCQSSYLPILAGMHNERSRFQRNWKMLLELRVEGLIIVAKGHLADPLLAVVEKNRIPTIFLPS